MLSRILLRVRIQRVIHWKLPLEPFLVRYPQRREALRHRSQPKAFRSGRFLSLHGGSADDASEPLQCGIGQMEVLEDRFERAALAAMIQRDFRESGRIERCGVLAFRRNQQLALRYEQEFGVAINE